MIEIFFETLFALFLILHGLVHLLYLGHSRGLFELQPDMAWPSNSWAFAARLGVERTGQMAVAICAMATAGFVSGGVGLLLELTWWRPLTIGVALFSSLSYILLWDGTARDLDDQGAVNVVINCAILLLLLWLRWPPV